MEGIPFGRYQLLNLLGRGGMGEVWRAHDRETDRIVAVKVLPAHYSHDRVFQERFRREAHRAARLNNAHVIPIHTYGEIDGRLYVDMRLIEGSDLQTVIDNGPLDPARAVRIVEEVAKALNAAHKVGLVHRDVKPSNILLDEDDFAYLIDFGIARAANEAGLTGTGGMVGTWEYMAPERLSDRQIDERVDIYALACVLHECLTGSKPFPGESVESQVAGHLSTPPPRPSNTNPGLPVNFDAVIATGMAKEPDQRYATTVELARAARNAMTAPSPRPMPTVSSEPPTAWGPIPGRPSPVAEMQPTVPVRRTPVAERQPTQPLPRGPASMPPRQRPPEQPPTQVSEPRVDLGPPPSTPPPTAQPAAKSRRPLIIGAVAAGVAVVVIGALTFAMTRGDSSSTGTTTASSPTGEPTAENTGPWHAHEFVAQAFPRLIPDAPDGSGYQGTTCKPVDGSGNEIDAATESPIARIFCEDASATGVSYTVYCTADRSVMTLASAGYTFESEKLEKWQRDNSTGDLRWGTTSDSTPIILVAFDQPDRNFCFIEALGGKSDQDIYDNWWKNAPI